MGAAVGFLLPGIMIRSLSKLSPRGGTKKKANGFGDNGNSPPPIVLGNSRGTMASPVTASTLVIQQAPAPAEVAKKTEPVYIAPSGFHERQAHTIMATKLQAIARGNSDRDVVESKKKAAERAAAEAERLAAHLVQEVLAAERRAAEEAAECERVAALKLAEANARKLAEMQAAHNEKKRGIAQAKAIQRSAEDELEARGAQLLEDELETRLTEDLTDLAEREASMQEAIAATDAMELEVKRGLDAARMKIAEIDALKERKGSIDQVVALLDIYGSRCVACRQPVTSAEETAQTSRAEEKSIASRAEVELKESKARLAKQAEVKAEAQAQLSHLTSECRHSEESALKVLKLATGEAASCELKLKLAEKVAALCSEETLRHSTHLAEAKVALAEQQSRAEETEKVLDEFRAKSDMDKKNVADLDDKISHLLAEEKHAVAAVNLADSAFETEGKSLALLKGVQEGLLAGEMPIAPATPHAKSSILEQATFSKAFSLSKEAASGQPTRQKLMAQTYDLVRERLASSEACATDLETRRKKYADECSAAQAQRQNELLVLHSVKGAIELGMAERATFSEKKQSQHEIERDEVRASVSAIYSLEECIKMLKAEATTLAAAKAEALAASKTADMAKTNAAEALGALRKESKERIMLMRAALASETIQANAAMAYTDGMIAQLTYMAVMKTANPFSAGFHWSGEGTGPGKAADKLLVEDQSANTAWLTQLKQEKVKSGSLLQQLEKDLGSAEQQASKELSRLAELRAKQMGVLSEFASYASSLETQSPRAAAASPRRSAKGSKESTAGSAPRAPLSSSADAPIRNLETDLVGPTGTAEAIDDLKEPQDTSSLSPTLAPSGAEVMNAQFGYLKKEEATIKPSPKAPRHAPETEISDQTPISMAV